MDNFQEDDDIAEEEDEDMNGVEEAEQMGTKTIQVEYFYYIISSFSHFLVISPF